LTTLVESYVSERTALGQWLPRTAAQTRTVLQMLFREADVSAVRELATAVERVEAVSAHLAPATRNGHLSHLRRFVNWLAIRGVVDPTLVESLPVVRWQPKAHLWRSLNVEGAMELANSREQLVIALTAFCGLRTIEVVRLKWNHVDLNERTLLATGKYRHERAVDLFNAYPVLARSVTHHDRLDGYVVSSRKQFSAQIGTSTVQYDLKRAFMRVNTQVSAHALRREGVRRRLEAGQSLEQLAAFLGHTSTEHTLRYLGAAVRGHREAIEGRDYTDESAKHSRDDSPIDWPVIPKPIRTRRKTMPRPNLRTLAEKVPLEVMVEQFVDRRRNRWSNETLVAQTALLRDFVHAADPLTHDSIVAWVASKRWANSTARTKMTQVRAFIRELLALGYLDADPTAALGYWQVPRKVPRILTASQSARLLSSVRSPSTKLICLLMLQQAMSAAAIARLNTEDFEIGTMVLWHNGVPQPLAFETVGALRAHLRRNQTRKGALIVTTAGTRASYDAICRRVGRACKAADVVGGAAVLRATGISGIVKSGAPVHAVRDAIGHADLTSTLRHTRPGEERGRYQSSAFVAVQDRNPSEQWFSHTEAARHLGISSWHLVQLARRVGVSEEHRVNGISLLSATDLIHIREHRVRHPHHNRHVVDEQVVDLIVRLVNDDRPFTWIANRFDRDGVSVGNMPGSWTPKKVARAYWRRIDDTTD
jgi:integrase